MPINTNQNSDIDTKHRSIRKLFFKVYSILNSQLSQTGAATCEAGGPSDSTNNATQIQLLHNNSPAGNETTEVQGAVVCIQ